KGFSHGAAVADLDGDGDLDIIINNLEEEAFIYENTSPSENNYLKIKLQGPEKNTLGLGAKVTLYNGDEIQYFENKIVRGYLSSCEPVLHFGVGQNSTIDSLRVQWNDGRENLLTEVKSNQLLVVDYSNADQILRKAPAKKKPFEEATKEIFSEPFAHNENVFNEFKE